MQSFLGKIIYLRAFIPNLSEISILFKELLKKHVIWNLSKQCETVFNNLKEILCNTSFLKNYKSKHELEIQFDASEKALGCCILQNKCPIYYASRCISNAEISFTQIEKEMLAISFACNKFHFLIYGRRIKVYSDHLYLVAVMKEELHKIPYNHLKRLRFIFLLYDIDLEYLPGKYMYIAVFSVGIPKKERTDKKII